jgi:DNA repair exonuclease SbcCD ATPase subunit
MNMEKEMKTPREQELENLLAEKDQQIKKLEGIVNELKMQLKGGGTSNSQELLNYYSRKYDEYFEDISKAKALDLDKEEKTLEKEIEDLNRKREMAQDTLKANEGVQLQIKGVEDQIHELDAKTREKEQATALEVNALIGKIDEIGDQYDRQFGNLMNRFSDALNKRLSFDEFSGAIDQFTAYLDNDGFAAVGHRKEHQAAVRKVHEVSHQEIGVISKQQEDLRRIIDGLKKQLVVTDIFDIEEQVFAKADALKGIREEKLTINDKFAGLKTKHLNNFNDILSKMRLFGKAPSEIGAEFEKLLDLFVQELNMVDEEKRHEEMRLKELSDVRSKAKEIEKLRNELPDKEKELADLQKTYADAHKEITYMESYIAKCKPLLDPSSKYYDWYLSFEAIREKINRLNSEKQNQFVVLEDLYRRRKQLVYNPFAKDMLKELDGKIVEEESKVNNIKTSLNDTIAVWNATDNNPEQARLKSIMEQKNRFEEKLPQLYKGLNELKAIVDDKYAAIAAIKEQILSLDKLYEEIGTLENENNN